jgi:hypothetical protein
MSSEQHYEVVRRLLARVTMSPWRWQPVEGTAQPTWELVQDGAAQTQVFALGEVLSVQARLIGTFTPAVLGEVATAEEQQLDAAERLEQAAVVLRRHLRRCYRLKQREHYKDVGRLARALASVLESLTASTQGSALLLKALEEARVTRPTG